MKKNQFIVMMLLVLVWSACTKHQLPTPPDGNTPQFYVYGFLGNDSLHWEAGKDNMYMHTSYGKDSANLMVLRGVLAPKGCDTCAPYLQIEFRDIEPTMDSVLAMDFNIHFRNRDFFGYLNNPSAPPQLIEVFNFTPLTQQPITSAFWQFDDGTTSTQLNPTHVFMGGGPRNVKLTVQQNGIVDSLVIPIDVSYNSPNRLMFTWNQDSLDVVSAQVSSGSFQSYSWQSGNGLSFQGPNATFMYNNQGVYTLSCKGTNGPKEAWYKAKIRVPAYANWANPNFTYTTQLIIDTMSQQPKNAGTAMLSLKKDGKEYRSYKNTPATNQTPVKILRVMNYTPFALNELGKPTISIDLSIDAWLYNTQNPNDSIQFRSNNARIALAYPQ